MDRKQSSIVVHTPEGMILPGKLFGTRVIGDSPVELRIDARNRGLMRRLLGKGALVEVKGAELERFNAERAAAKAKRDAARTAAKPSADAKPERPAPTMPARKGKE